MKKAGSGAGAAHLCEQGAKGSLFCGFGPDPDPGWILKDLQLPNKKKGIFSSNLILYLQ